MGYFSAERTGRGQSVDVAQYEVFFVLLENLALDYFLRGMVRGRHGAAHPRLHPYDVHRASDGWVVVAAPTPDAWAGLRDLIAFHDPAYDDRDFRLAHREPVDAAIAEFCRGRTREELERLGREHDVAINRIMNIADIANDPHYRARGMFLEWEDPVAGRVKEPEWRLDSPRPRAAFGAALRGWARTTSKSSPRSCTTRPRRSPSSTAGERSVPTPPRGVPERNRRSFPATPRDSRWTDPSCQRTRSRTSWTPSSTLTTFPSEVVPWTAYPEFPHPEYRAMGEAGWLGLTTPVAFGGRGLPGCPRWRPPLPARIPERDDLRQALGATRVLLRPS